MHADDVSALQNAGSDGRCGTPDPLVALGILARLGAQYVGDETFSGCADQERVTELGELGQSAEQFEILRVVLAETDAGIDDDLRFCHACATCERDCAA